MIMQRTNFSLILSTLTLLAAVSFVSAAPVCTDIESSSSAAATTTATATASAPVPTDTTPAETDSESSNSTEANVVATGWYAGWLADKLPPANISWEKYSALTFAFATTTPDTSVIALDDQSATVLPTFVTEAHNNGVDALLSIGGWTGSIYYSTAVGSAENRTTFVKTVVDLVAKYNLDGIDFDWEYPNHQGIGCNTINDADSANLLSFLQELRQDPVGANLTLTAAVGITPFAGPDGTPMTNVSGFADVLDHIAIMNYDVWGSFSPTVGPNAPLDDTCAPTPGGSATSALKAWTDAQFPASKLVLGVASYGHSFHVDSKDAKGSDGQLALYPPFDKSLAPLGEYDVPGAAPSQDQCGNPVGVDGSFDFNGLIAAGFLDAAGSPAAGIDYRFDNCSQTPFVYNPTSDVMVSFDDATSFAAKGKFITDNNMAGFAVWHIAGDSNDILLNAISEAMNIAPQEDCDS